MGGLPLPPWNWENIVFPVGIFELLTFYFIFCIFSGSCSPLPYWLSFRYTTVIKNLLSLIYIKYLPGEKITIHHKHRTNCSILFIIYIFFLFFDNFSSNFVFHGSIFELDYFIFVNQTVRMKSSTCNAQRLITYIIISDI